MAVKTKLGWILSGPLKGKTEVGAISVNFSIENRAPYPMGGSTLDREVNGLWDLETLGIREEKESVHEPLFDNIRINGTRYSAQLPWKKSREELPTNYATSQARLNSLLRKLRKEPEILREYNFVIKDQL